MSLYGPFRIPANTSSIAPFLMANPDKDVTLLKPIVIILPHSIHQASNYSIDSLGVRVIKSNHTCQANGEYVFEDIDEEESRVSFETREMKEYAIFYVSHFCFLSLRCDPSSRATKTKTCCIGPMYPTQYKFRCTYHLPITYYMDPWIKASVQLYIDTLQT